MKTATALLAACFLIQSGVFAQPTDQDLIKLRGLYQKGSTSYQKKDYGKAMESFLEFIKLLPQSEQFARARAEAYLNVARCLSLTKKTQEAIEHLENTFKFGYRDFDTIKKDSDLNSIRSHPDFTSLVTRYERIKDAELQKSLEKFDFNLVSVQGKPIAKKDFLGKVLIVDVWGTWCPPCRMEVPHFIELIKRREKDGLRMVGLNHERTAPNAQKAAEIVKDFIDNNDVNYPCALIDLDFVQSIPDFSGYPTTLFFDRQGKVRKVLVGMQDLKALEDVVDPLLKEKAPDPVGEKPAEGGPGNPAPPAPKQPEAEKKPAETKT